MSKQTENTMTTAGHSVLVVSKNQSFTDSVTSSFFKDGKDIVRTEADAFQTINGKAANVAFSSDVVIFEALPDDEKELAALADLLRGRTGGTVFLAMTDSDMPIGKARKLREIGVDEVLPISITRDELDSVINDAMSMRRTADILTAPALPRATEGTVISVAQARGGIGSTTVAVNLACSLAGQKGVFRKRNKRRVALVDLDIQFGNANVFLDMEDNGGFQKMIEDDVLPDAQYLRGIMQHHPSGVDLLSAPSAVVPLNSIDTEMVAALIDGLRTEYDYVVVDLPRALVDWLEPVIERSTRLQIVMDRTIPSIRHAKRLMDFYHEAQIGLPVDLIVNREAKPMFRSSQCREAESVLEQKFAHWLPYDPKVARKSVDLGKPIAIGFTRSALSKSFGKLSRMTQSAAAEAPRPAS